MPKFAVSLTEHSIDYCGLDPTTLVFINAQNKKTAARLVMIDRILSEEKDSREENIADNDFDDGRKIGKEAYLLPEKDFLMVRRAYWLKNFKFDSDKLAEDYDFYFCDDSTAFGLMVLPLPR